MHSRNTTAMHNLSQQPLKYFLKKKNKTKIKRFQDAET